MPSKYFKISLSKKIEIHVYFETISGLIINFAVKLIFFVDDEKFYEVIRYDSGHNCPHKDILDVDGKVIKKVWYKFLDNKQALDLAIKDLKDNHELYILRFKKWLQR